MHLGQTCKLSCINTSRQPCMTSFTDQIPTFSGRDKYCCCKWKYQILSKVLPLGTDIQSLQHRKGYRLQDKRNATKSNRISVYFETFWDFYHYYFTFHYQGLQVRSSPDKTHTKILLIMRRFCYNHFLTNPPSKIQTSLFKPVCSAKE